MSYYFDAVLYYSMNVSLPAVALYEREQLPMTAGVYLVVDVQHNEVIYVGQSLSLRKRWYNHNQLSKINRLPFVLIACLDIEDHSRLTEFEQMFIDHYQPILNSIGRRKYIDFKIKLPLEDYQRLKQAISHTEIDRNKLVDALIVAFSMSNNITY